MSAGNPFEINYAASTSLWSTMNDNVMGGVSVGRVDQSGDSMRFFGRLSNENRGGFSSAKTKFSKGDFSQFSGVDIEYKGNY